MLNLLFPPFLSVSLIVETIVFKHACFNKVSLLVNRSRPSSKMTKYVECWGADKPFANIAEATLAKNIGLTVSCHNSFILHRHRRTALSEKYLFMYTYI